MRFLSLLLLTACAPRLAAGYIEPLGDHPSDGSVLVTGHLDGLAGRFSFRRGMSYDYVGPFVPGVGIGSRVRLGPDSAQVSSGLEGVLTMPEDLFHPSLRAGAHGAIGTASDGAPAAGLAFPLDATVGFGSDGIPVSIGATLEYNLWFGAPPTWWAGVTAGVGF